VAPLNVDELGAIEMSLGELSGATGSGICTASTPTSTATSTFDDDSVKISTDLVRYFTAANYFSDRAKHRSFASSRLSYVSTLPCEKCKHKYATAKWCADHYFGCISLSDVNRFATFFHQHQHHNHHHHN